MIYNIIDRRKHPYKFNEIDAIIEATWHDNTCPEADKVEEEDTSPGYDERRQIPLHEALDWASRHEGKVTLYLYDKGSA